MECTAPAFPSAPHAAEGAARALRWRCRRGLLELDLLLGGFWERHHATLEPGEMAALERLLTLSDMEIADRLQGGVPAGDADLEALVQRLRLFRNA